MEAGRFREVMPAFSDTNKYPEAQVSFFLELANTYRTEAWPDGMVEWGTALFAAHHLTLFQQGQSGQAGNVGPKTSKSVHDVSASYDTQIATSAEAGHWNLSTYGLQFWRLIRMIGAGPVHLSGASAPAGTPLGFRTWWI